MKNQDIKTHSCIQYKNIHIKCLRYNVSIVTMDELVAVFKNAIDVKEFISAAVTTDIDHSSVVVKRRYYDGLNDNNKRLYDELSDNILAKKESFYCVKVQVKEDYRSLEDLKRLFPQIQSVSIDKIWDERSTWSEVFDVLSSLLNSHDNHCLNKCIYGNFTSSSHVWPSLNESINSCDDWIVQKMDDMVVDCDAITDVNIHSTHAYHNNPPSDVSNPHISNSKPSYLDILLTESKPTHIEKPVIKKVKELWKPTIVIKALSKQHVGKLYGPQADNSSSNNDDDCDDDDWDCIFGQVQMKVNECKSNPVTFLKPKQVHCKEMRIAVKST